MMERLRSTRVLSRFSIRLLMSSPYYNLYFIPEFNQSHSRTLNQSQLGSHALYVDVAWTRRLSVRADLSYMMSLTPGFCGPIHVCRRLFCEPTQNLVHQTLEAVMRKDQERFSKLWNFPPSDVTGRQPLVSRNVVTSDSEPNLAAKNEPTVSSWRLFQPEAGFYVTPPRKLKAYRRLNQSVAQKTRLEMLCIPNTNAPSSASTNSEIPLEEKCDQLRGNPTPVKCHSPSVQVQTVTAPGRPLTPILIRPSPEEEPPRLPYLEQLNLQDGLKGPIRSGHKITLVRSRHSEQIKRRSGAKVTDYFTVSKRPRQSLK